MMRQILWLCVWGVFVQRLAAAELTLPTLKVGHKIYTNATVIGATDTDLYFHHAHGIANAKLKYLEPELQRRFRYDPAKAAKAEAQQIADDARYLEELAQAAAAARKHNPATDLAPEERLLDSVSDKSFLNNPAPELVVKKWLSEQPDWKGKFVIVSFWASWSAPCRRLIPEFNAYQKRFRDKLVVIGISAEAEKDVVQMDGPKIEYFSGLDPDSRLRNALGVTTVPEVVLIDPKGIVRYQGHPAAINLKLLQTLVKRYAGD